ncbi:hypothetical protein, partial [Mycobacterium avium]|uniref:hypothetical protein n=1 Tax=Mycobacterium avium TaxID=1764 RepID=UPI001C0A8824
HAATIYTTPRHVPKCPHDLRKCPRYHGVIGSLPKRDIQFPKMTNAAASSTVRVSPQRVTEE